MPRVRVSETRRFFLLSLRDASDDRVLCGQGNLITDEIELCGGDAMRDAGCR